LSLNLQKRGQVHLIVGLRFFLQYRLSIPDSLLSLNLQSCCYFSFLFLFSFFFFSNQRLRKAMDREELLPGTLAEPSQRRYLRALSYRRVLHGGTI